MQINKGQITPSVRFDTAPELDKNEEFHALFRGNEVLPVLKNQNAFKDELLTANPHKIAASPLDRSDRNGPPTTNRRFLNCRVLSPAVALVIFACGGDSKPIAGIRAPTNASPIMMIDTTEDTWNYYSADVTVTREAGTNTAEVSNGTTQSSFGIVRTLNGDMWSSDISADPLQSSGPSNPLPKTQARTTTCITQIPGPNLPFLCESREPTLTVLSLQVGRSKQT